MIRIKVWTLNPQDNSSQQQNNRTEIEQNRKPSPNRSKYFFGRLFEGKWTQLDSFLGNITPIKLEGSLYNTLFVLFRLNGPWSVALLRLKINIGPVQSLFALPSVPGSSALLKPSHFKYLVGTSRRHTRVWDQVVNLTEVSLKTPPLVPYPWPIPHPGSFYMEGLHRALHPLQKTAIPLFSLITIRWMWIYDRLMWIYEGDAFLWRLDWIIFALEIRQKTRVKSTCSII